MGPIRKARFPHPKSGGCSTKIWLGPTNRARFQHQNLAGAYQKSPISTPKNSSISTHTHIYFWLRNRAFCYGLRRARSKTAIFKRPSQFFVKTTSTVCCSVGSVCGFDGCRLWPGDRKRCCAIYLRSLRRSVLTLLTQKLLKRELLKNAL